MGIHTGQPIRTKEGYVGIDLHRGARICAAGHGGQVLISRTTRQLLDSSVEVRDLGEHRLKDLQDPEWLFQLIVPDLSQQFPPLRSLNNTNLPAEANSLIGRHRELAETKALLEREDVRILTLTGPGGTGKTRLALRLAAHLVEDFKNGVFLVALAPLSDPALVLSTVAQTLGVKEKSGETVAESLRRQLEGKSVLLVLDNFEHVLPAAWGIGQILQSAPQVKVLATSRERLHLVGEYEHPVHPLSEHDAVALFKERAGAVASGFRPDEDPGSVAAICHKLDLLPLAVELAAARTKLMSPKELLARLGKALPLLVGGPGDMPQRQQTLSATIDWSYKLLDTRDRRVFVRLSVFAGGCTLDAADAICDAGVDAIASLLDKSLLRREGDRYLMLETIREYAVQRLDESGSEREKTVRRHAAWFVDFAERSDNDLRGLEGSNVSRRLRLEHDNLRAVLQGALDRADAETLLRLATALWSFWMHHGHLREGLSWLRRALLMSDQQPARLRAQAHLGASAIAMTQGELVQARGDAEASLRLAHELNDDRLIATASNSAGNISASSGDFVDAAEHYAEARSVSATLRDDQRSAMVLRNWGYVELAQGRVDRAVELLTESLAFATKGSSDRQIAYTLSSLGMARLAQGDLEASRASIVEAFERSVLAEDNGLILACVEFFASLLATREQWEQAARLFAFAQGYRVATGISDVTGLGVVVPYAARVHRVLKPEILASASLRGRTMSLLDAVAEVRSLDAMASEPQKDMH